MNTTTKIQLVDGPVEGYLDVKENVSLPLNFGIGDIRNIEERSGAFSKTVSLVGNHNNNKILNDYYDVNIQAGTFDLNQIHRCIVIQNGVPILENAYLRLLSVKKVQNLINQDELVEYQVQVRDSLSDFFKDINNKELTDIAFDDLDHIYDAANVVSSFNNTWVDGYKYVMPWIGGSNSYNLNECKPGVYALQYWNRIHELAGYEYEFAELTASTVQLDKLIIPFNGDDSKLTEEFRNDFEVLANNNSVQQDIFSIPSTTGLFSNISYQKVNVTNEIKDNQGYYTPATSLYDSAFFLSSPNSLDYEIDVVWELDVYNASSANAILVYATTTYKPVISVLNQSNAVKGTKPLYYTWKNPVVPMSYSNTTITLPFGSGSYTFSPGSNIIASGSTSFTINATNINTSDILKLAVAMPGSQTGMYWVNSSTGTGVSVYPKIKIKSLSLRIVPNAQTLAYSMPVLMKNFIPKKIKQSEFLKSIYMMYNIFVEVDPENSKKLIYKTRDYFYDSGVERDWSKKIDKKKEQNLLFVPELSSKKAILTYKQDNSDLLLKHYLEATNEVYGQVEVEFDNENVKGVDKKEIIFSPTCNQPTDFGAVCPVWPTVSPKMNIRILLDNGEQPCGTYFIKNYQGNQVTVNTYPFISHLDKYTNPSFDINFGICDYYPYDIKNYTANNLFTNNWRRTLSQINNGKLFTAYFNLTERDMFLMKLNDKIFCNNAWWSINKIIDYNAESHQLTKVELLSIDDDLRLPRFGRNVKPVLPSVPVKPVRPVLPSGPFKPVVGPLKEISKIRSFQTSIVDSNKSTEMMGVNNNLKAEFNGIVIGDNIIATEPGIYNGDVHIGFDGKITYISGVIIDAGMSTVLPPYKDNFIDVIDGTYNKVRNMGGDSKERHVIDGQGIIENKLIDGNN